jgi:hypothetical protein
LSDLETLLLNFNDLFVHDVFKPFLNYLVGSGALPSDFNPFFLVMGPS